jgi:hypothetical protein
VSLRVARKASTLLIAQSGRYILAELGLQVGFFGVSGALSGVAQATAAYPMDNGHVYSLC